MSIQTDLTFTDITLRQEQLRREAREARMGRRARRTRPRPGLLARLVDRRHRGRSATVTSPRDH